MIHSLAISYKILLKRVADGEMQGQAVLELADVVISVTIEFRRIMEADAAVEAEDEEVQVVTQAEAGAQVLDVNAGLPGIDEAATLEQLVKELQAVTDLPLQLDSSNVQALENGLRVYNGKPIVNSTNGEPEKLKAIQRVQCTARREELMDTASDKLTEARAEYDSQKAEAERQFAEAEAKLADAQAQLDAAKAQLEAGEKEPSAQKAALPDTMQSGADKLVSSEEQVLEFEEQLPQIELMVNLKKVADTLLTSEEAALRKA